MKALVIGANGFIASNLISEIKKDSQVVGVYHSHKENLENDIVNISMEQLNEAGTDFETVYLLSAHIPYSNVNEETRKKLFEVNVELVERICSRFRNSRIIYGSSVSVYKQKEGVIYESDDEGGLNEYGISKLWAEKIVQTMKSYAIVRFSSVYGSKMKTNTIIPSYIKQAIGENVITVWGNGARKQNYIHVRDVVTFLKAAASIHENDVFLATSKESISNMQLAEMIAAKTGCGISFKNEDFSPSYYYNNDYTVSKLKHRASVSIDYGLSELIEWIKEKY